MESHEESFPLSALYVRLPLVMTKPRSSALLPQICLCEFESKDLLRQLPCSHAFHQPCVDGLVTQW